LLVELREIFLEKPVQVVRAIAPIPFRYRCFLISARFKPVLFLKVAQLAARMLMCLCSCVASGRVVRSPGLQKRGFVAGDNLQLWKARLLPLALTKTNNADEIQRMFDPYYCDPAI
jgi:hypothetical protein